MRQFLMHSAIALALAAGTSTAYAQISVGGGSGISAGTSTNSGVGIGGRGGMNTSLGVDAGLGANGISSGIDGQTNSDLRNDPATIGTDTRATIGTNGTPTTGGSTTVPGARTNSNVDSNVKINRGLIDRGVARPVPQVINRTTGTVNRTGGSVAGTISSPMDTNVSTGLRGHTY